MYVLLLNLTVQGTYHICTMYVPFHTFYLYSEPCFTGFRGVLRDANMLVSDAQQPPADQDIDKGDPCPEDGLITGWKHYSDVAPGCAPGIALGIVLSHVCTIYPIQFSSEILRVFFRTYNVSSKHRDFLWIVLCPVRSEVAYFGTGPILS